MIVPFHKPDIGDEEINAVSEVIRSGWLTMGTKTIEFEKKVASRTGATHAVAVNSCTAALHLALRVLDIRPGDEVILPAMTFASTAEVVLYFNAHPVMADIHPDTHLMREDTLERLVTAKTRAVIPVHYAGIPCDMDSILGCARAHGFPVIEDAAHALPAMFKGRTIGTFGDITCFSFYATKTLSTGEGGMAVTERGDWADRMRLLRLHGISRDAWKRYTADGTWEYDVHEVGYKYNTTDMNAALGMVQLDKLDRMLAARERIAAAYNSAFADNDALIPYTVPQDRVSAWHVYPLKIRPESLSIDRNRFIVELKEMGVGTSVHFIPLYRFSFYKQMGYNMTDYPGCEWVFEREISLPIYSAMTGDEVDHVIRCVLETAKRYKR